MIRGWNVTFSEVTPASAEDGDYSDQGFDLENATLAEALRELGLGRSRFNGALYNCGRWFEEIDGSIDYRTGAERRRALHPPQSITPASYARVARLLSGGRRRHV